MCQQRLQVLILLILTTNGFAIWSSLIETHGCACPGDRVSYKCSVAGLEPGIGNTIWRGSALDVLCSQSGGELVLHHRSFNETRICGNITVQGIKVHVGESSCYTSQLNVTVDSRLDNETLSIECIYNDGTNKTVIGTSSVEVTKGPYPPPNDIKLDALTLNNDNNSIELIFKWSPVAMNCPTLYYAISSKCGLCPNTTNDPSAMCSANISELYGGQCTFEVKTGVCNRSDDFLGATEMIQLNLTVPDAPFAKVIPWYSYETMKLTTIMTTILCDHNMAEINEPVNAPVTNYTIVCIDSLSGNACYSADIKSTCCDSKEKVCKHKYNLSLSTCSHQGDIIVRVSATNVFGSGLPGNTTVEFNNTFVIVSFHPKYTCVYCKFLYIPSTNYGFNCSITYGDYHEQNSTNNVMSDTVVVEINTTKLNQLPSSSKNFTVTATNGTSTVHIKGIFNTTVTDEAHPIPDSENGNVVVVISTTSTVFLLGMVSILGLVLLFLMKNKLKILCHVSGIQTDNSEVRSDSQQTGRYNVVVHDPEHFDTEELGIYSLAGPVAQETDAEVTDRIKGVYADVHLNTATEERILYPMSDDRVQYSELNHCETNDPVTDVAKVCEPDKAVNLDTLLIQLRDEVTPHWQKFGRIIGVPNDMIVKCSKYPPDQCMIEILDYWLRQHNDAPLTWRDVAQALRQINLSQLSETILETYVTESGSPKDSNTDR